MIQPQELRIGNYVNHDNSTTQVTSIEFNRLHTQLFSSLNHEEVEPIELTEEWLVKLGFIKDNGSWYKLPLPELCGGQITYIVTEGKIFGLVCENEQSFGCKEVAELYNELKEEFNYIPKTSDIWINNIKYVHHIQNLYHSLSGQELTIKE